MENINITLTPDEANELYALLKESCNTGNKEWDEIMKNILHKIDNEL